MPEWSIAIITEFFLVETKENMGTCEKWAITISTGTLVMNLKILETVKQ